MLTTVGGFYVFDEPFYVRWYWNLAFNFVTSPVKHNVHICGQNYTKLHTIVDDVTLLPTVLGGEQILPGIKPRSRASSGDDDDHLSGTSGGSDALTAPSVFRAKMKMSKVAPINEQGEGAY